MKRPIRRAFLRAMCLGLVMAASIVIAGCGGGKTTVTGEVKIDGVPVPSGDVKFHFKDELNTVVTGKIVDGTYKINDCLPGEALVTVYAEPPPEIVKAPPGKGMKMDQGGPLKINEAGETKEKEDKELRDKWKKVPRVPATYRIPEKKWLPPYPGGGAKTYDIALDSKKK
jgi:hypothetical protein